MKSSANRLRGLFECTEKTIVDLIWPAPKHARVARRRGGASGPRNLHGTKEAAPEADEEDWRAISMRDPRRSSRMSITYSSDS